MLRTIMVAALAVGGSLVLAPTPPAAAADTPFTVYLSPTGSDSNDGRTPTSALATLDGAQAALVAAAPQTDAGIRIAAGTYVATAASHRWRFYVPGHSVSFLPATYRPDRPTPLAKRPVFHGPDTPAWWMQVNLPNGDQGGDTNLRFHDL